MVAFCFFMASLIIYMLKKKLGTNKMNYMNDLLQDTPLHTDATY